MKNTIFSLAAAFALLTATTASAASISRQDGPGRNDNGRTTNYGYDKNHQVTPEERAKWEAQHKNDRRDDKNDRRDDKNDRRDDKNDRRDDKNDHRDDKNDRRDDKNDRRDDKKGPDKNDRGNNGNGRGPGRNDNGRTTNYGYDKNHQVTPEERTAWEAQHKNDQR